MNSLLNKVSHGLFLLAGVIFGAVIMFIVTSEPRCNITLQDTVKVRDECARTALQCIDALQVCEHARSTTTTLLGVCEASSARITDMISNRASCWTPTETEWIE
jgi:hypothetical protein